jgi:hypothetical protein
MLTILLGILFIIGGLSGQLVFIGTNSGVLLAVVGLILVIWGGYRMYQRSRTLTEFDPLCAIRLS